jgi:hypothetical protein
MRQIQQLPIKQSIRDKEATQKRDVRMESARIVIPDCVDPKRRELCLSDPERFLRTYFASDYTLDFGADHLFMIDAIASRAQSGGRQAIAAPRGRGKSQIVKGMLAYLACAGLVRFPLSVAATSDLAKLIYRDFKKKFSTNELLREDFPEICYPIMELQGAPQRASRQHIDGIQTGIVWTDDYIRFGDVTCSNAICKTFGGFKMSYYGLDSAFRGVNIDADRPDFILVDDPETRESAKSHSQIEDREQILDKDISGLVGQEDTLAIVVLTTVQNRISLSYKLTDTAKKPAYNGKRFGMVLRWPANTFHWDRYIQLRQESQIAGDELGLLAVDYYRANRTEMDEGVSMLSDHCVSVSTSDGTETVLSAIQQAYNKIADTSRKAYDTEYQNDPPEEAGPQGNGISYELVASRISGLAKRQLPANTCALTTAIDLGKYKCHWVVIAWWPGAGGVITDYGIAEVSGTDKSLDNEASEPQIYKTLLNWRDELLSKNYTDATGVIRKVDFCMVDSGTFTNAAYEFCRQVKGIFHPSKGMNPYHPRKQSTPNIIAGANLHAQRFHSQDIWLYELDANHWKQWVHERFMSPTCDEMNMLRRGALSIYQPEGSQKHVSFAQHIAAEELLTQFTEGKGIKTYWHAKNENNHWLDATAMASAASEACGIKLIAQSEVEVKPRHVETTTATKPQREQPKSHQHGTRFKSRPGGWIPRRR